MGPSKENMSRTAYGAGHSPRGILRHREGGGDVGVTAVQGASTSDVLETEEARSLLEAAQAAGRVSAEEIALSLDELELEPAQLEDVYRALEELHVEIVDAGATEAKEEER